MATRTSSSPANAGAITRILKAAGLTHGEEHKASRGVVRGGWSTFTTGFVSEQVMEHDRRRVRAGSYRDGAPRYEWRANNTPTGYVTVGYQFSRALDGKGPERKALAERELTRAAEILRRKGFEVTVNEPSDQYSVMSLHVCRKDADGKVVIW